MDHGDEASEGKQLFFGQTRPEVVLLLSSVYPLVRGGVELVLYLAVGWLFGGLSLVAFASLGLWAAALSVLFRLGNPFVWVIGSSSWLLSGVLYPPALLPAPLRWAAGAPLQELAVPALWLAGFILLVAPSGLAVFNAGLTRTRIHGTLVGG
jgi:hypothetical protein